MYTNYCFHLEGNVGVRQESEKMSNLMEELQSSTEENQATKKKNRPSVCKN
jgi:hypothetical protein